MVQIVCNCLNVGIHCKENQLNSTLKNNDNYFDENDDNFLKNCVSVTLALAGITMEHDYLCWTRIVGQWAINHCAVCKTDTHATHINNDNQRRILVNINLESNVSRIESLRTSHSYSPVFRLILPSKFDNQLIHSRPVKKISTVIEAKKRSLQQRVQRFLSEEQKRMEERIRTFTEQEHSRFAEMQLKIGRNEESLYDLLEEIGDKLNIKSDNDKSNGYLTEQSVIQNEDSKIDNNYSYLDLNSKPSQTIAHQKLIDNKQKKSQQFGRYRSQSVDYELVGGVFDIDVDEGNAFDSISYSDEEEDDSMAFRTASDYSYSNRSGQPLTQNNAQMNGSMNGQMNGSMNGQMNGSIAFSLPIQVPQQWKTYKIIKEEKDEDNVPMIPNGESIAENIQKLARSVRNETDIFGDRPRRRLNTGDLIKSRPI